MHYDRGLIVVIEYYLQIWDKKEYIIISRVISSHMNIEHPMHKVEQSKEKIAVEKESSGCSRLRSPNLLIFHI